MMAIDLTNKNNNIQYNWLIIYKAYYNFSIQLGSIILKAENYMSLKCIQLQKLSKCVLKNKNKYVYVCS